MHQCPLLCIRTLGLFFLSRTPPRPHVTILRAACGSAPLKFQRFDSQQQARQCVHHPSECALIWCLDPSQFDMNGYEVRFVCPFRTWSPFQTSGMHISLPIIQHRIQMLMSISIPSTRFLAVP
ncbi:hypothetical protein EDD15DRAFT_906315 [Pisolithus albus]|nr:hypothetical protein EDD15DRAFT_906315 [Pisolithus albus]